MSRDTQLVADLLPHRAPMVLLDAVLEHAARRTVCVATIDEGDALFCEEGVVPAWVGLEHMAQCIAAHAGLLARAAGDRPPVGLLIGSRQVTFHATGFTPGQRLIVSADHVWGETALASFACAMHDSRSGALLVEGTLNVFVSKDPHLLASRTAR